MLSFRSILFAAAALATVVSAVPTPDTSASGVTNNAPGVGSAVTNVLGGGLSGRGESQYPGDYFQTCRGTLAPIIVELKAAVNVNGGAKKVDRDHVISLLGEIYIALEVLLKNLKVIVKADVVLRGSVQVLAGIVAGLLLDVIVVIKLVVGVVGFVDVTVIANIGGILCEVLRIVLGLVDGLLAAVVIIIRPYGGYCDVIKYTDILVLLGIA